jgi:ferric-dicitrate binding protein FerR (iron transport regulator)
MAAAALVVVAVVLSVMVLSEDKDRTVAATAADDVRQITLADGSTVRLMANSRLVYATPGAEEPFDRTVTLDEGRAFFEVAAAPRRFVVETPTARTIALGTSFGMEVRSGETQVVLATGRVEVAARGDTARAVTLQPGQVSRVTSEGTLTAPASVDITDALDWTGLFIFREAPMATIAERLARHYQTSITVAPALANQAVTGTFEQQRALAPILQTIAVTLEARVERTDDGYRIQPGGDAP